MPAAPMLKLAECGKPIPAVWIRFVSAAAGQSNEHTIASSSASRNTTAMRSRNGSSGHSALIATDRTNEPIVAAGLGGALPEQAEQEDDDDPWREEACVLLDVLEGGRSCRGAAGREDRAVIATTAAIRPTVTRRVSPSARRSCCRCRWKIVATELILKRSTQ